MKGCEMRNLVLVCSLMFSPFVIALEVGVSGSGGAISLDLWSSKKFNSQIGLYSKFLWDFEEYEDGTTLNVCSDGAISGSSGSGTCSGHGGVSSTKPTEFNRYGLVLGPTYWLSNRIRLHGGLVAALYSSDVNIGDKSERDFTEIGADIGASYSLADDGSRIVLSYETEQQQTYLGFSIPVW